MTFEYVKNKDVSFSQIANKLRDDYLGRNIRISAHIHMITPCSLVPRCNYCSLSSNINNIRNQRDVLTIDELIKSISHVLKYSEITSIILVGGTNLNGQDSILIKIVRTVRNVTDVPVGIDVGAPIGYDTLSELKDYDISPIYSSLETINKELFYDAKPGDSFDKRLQLLYDLEKLGISSGTILMNGIGSLNDLMNSIEFLGKFKMLSHLYISTFKPVPGTPWAGKKEANILDSIKAIEFARMKLHNVNIGLADVGVEAKSVEPHILNELEHGAGNILTGILIYKGLELNYLNAIRKIEDHGYHIVKRG